MRKLKRTIPTLNLQDRQFLGLEEKAQKKTKENLNKKNQNEGSESSKKNVLGAENIPQKTK